MANLPFHLNFDADDPPSFYNPEAFPKNMYSHLHPRQFNGPIDMRTLGMISALAPHLRHLDVHGKVKEDLAHLPEKTVSKEKHLDFQIYLDVGLFTPEELSVKIVNDHVIIEGKHEERQAHDIGYVTRHFMRRYELPKGYNPDALVSKLSPDGVLSVILPKPSHNANERIITIQQGGPHDTFFKKHKSIQNDFVSQEKEKVKAANNGVEKDEETKK